MNKIIFFFIFYFFLNQAIAKENIMILKLKDGDVIIELFNDIAPNHVERFKKLSEEKKYDGVVFHRVIDGFMAQSGDVQFGNINDENYDLKIGKFHQAIIDKALTHIFTTPILMLREALQNFRYIGPLRTIPERTFEPDRFPNEGRWSDGLGAWDDLFRKLSDDYKDHSDYLKQINKWMEDLNLGYTIKIKEYKELVKGS